MKTEEDPIKRAKERAAASEPGWKPVLEVRFRDAVAEPGFRGRGMNHSILTSDEIKLDLGPGLVRARKAGHEKLYPLGNVLEITCS